MRHRIPFLIALAAAATACTATGPLGPVPPTPEAAPVTLPEAHLEALDGAATDLASVVAGHAALISLWATWCDPCVAEVGALDRLDDQTRKSGDSIVVAVDVGEPRDTVAAFARDHAVRYRVLVDPDFALADALGQRRVPATLVVDRTGRIVYRGGAIDAPALAALRRAANAHSEDARAREGASGGDGRSGF
jgi:thiol-disulfide isomerase/thioredoxin